MPDHYTIENEETGETEDVSCAAVDRAEDTLEAALALIRMVGKRAETEQMH